MSLCILFCQFPRMCNVLALLQIKLLHLDRLIIAQKAAVPRVPWFCGFPFYFFEILILFHMLQALIDDGPDMVICEGIEN